MPTHDPLNPKDPPNTPTDDGEIKEEDLESVVGGGPPSSLLDISTSGTVSGPSDDDNDTGSLFV
jgi:hypothetical protein